MIYLVGRSSTGMTHLLTHDGQTTEGYTVCRANPARIEILGASEERPEVTCKRCSAASDRSIELDIMFGAFASRIFSEAQEQKRQASEGASGT